MVRIIENYPNYTISDKGEIVNTKTNNCVSNLEWITPKDNCNYGTRNERQGLGHSKPIEQYDLEGNFIKEWESAAEVEKVLGFNHSNMSKCCLGRYNVAYNYKWKFK